MTTATIKLALLTSNYIPAQETDSFLSEISVNEVSGTNYVAGGNVCRNLTAVMVAGLITVDCDNPNLWNLSPTGFTNAQRAVLYIDTGVAATSRLIAYSDLFALARGNTTASYAISFSTDGVFTIPR